MHAHPEASPYHLSAWARAIEAGYGHPARPIVACEGDRVVGVLPLFEFAGPFGRRSWVSSPFCDLGGPLAERPEIAEALVESACQLAGEATIDLRAATPLSLSRPSARRAEHKVRMLLELPESSEALLASFKAKLRSQVRKAEKNGCEFTWGADQVDDFYAIFSINMRDLGSPVHAKRLFDEIVSAFGEHAHLGVVRFEGRPVAAGLALSVGGRMAIPWASSLRAYNKLAPNMLLYWNLLKRAADGGFTSFDFGRSSEGEGTYRFKAQWGASPQPLHWLELGEGAAPEPQAGPGRGRQLAESLWRRLPLPVANLVGPRVRRYVSL